MLFNFNERFGVVVYPFFKLRFDFLFSSDFYSFFPKLLRFDISFEDNILESIIIVSLTKFYEELSTVLFKLIIESSGVSILFGTSMMST